MNESGVLQDPRSRGGGEANYSTGLVLVHSIFSGENILMKPFFSIQEKLDISKHCCEKLDTKK